MTVLWLSPITTAVIFCAYISTVSIVLHSCAGKSYSQINAFKATSEDNCIYIF